MKFPILEANVHNVAHHLSDCLKKQRSGSVKAAIKSSHDKLVCTHFDEPSYIDLHHFYSNLRRNVDRFALHNDGDSAHHKHQLTELLDQGCGLIKNLVLANTAGKNLSQAQGISIYFPETRIHHSYRKTPFAAHNEWINFLINYHAPIN